MNATWLRLLSVLAGPLAACCLSANAAETAPAGTSASALAGERLVFVSHNFMRPRAVEETLAVVRQAAKAGYTGILLADCKFSRWDEKVTVQRPQYDRNVRRIRAACRELKLKVIAVVCDQGADLLSNDPNLAEGMPVVDAPFVARGGALVPADADYPLRNPAFTETRRPNQPTGWFLDDPGKCAFLDKQVTFDGKPSVRFQDIRANSSCGNGRVIQQVRCKPFRYYHVSVRIKTEKFDAPRTVDIMALSPKHGLIHQTLGVKPTQDWKRYDVVFNTLDNPSANFYAGSWGGGKGTLWLADLRVEPGGFVNVLRRDSLPCRIASADGKTVYEEGKDYARIRDPKLGNVRWPGDFDYWHEPPRVAVVQGGRIADGQTVLASYSHSMNMLGWGIFACMSEPKTLKLMKRQLAMVHKIIEPDGYFLAHDEIRHMGWDASCRKKGLSMGKLLAENVKACLDAIRKEDPGKPIYAWSDMFDPYHNAGKVGYYYLVRGKDPWQGGWETLDKDVIVVNWNSNPAKRVDSMKWFASRGHRQILAGYYDAPSERIVPWLSDAAKIGGVVGVMYTTWARDFRELEKFSRIVRTFRPK